MARKWVLELTCHGGPESDDWPPGSVSGIFTLTHLIWVLEKTHILPHRDMNIMLRTRVLWTHYTVTYRLSFYKTAKRKDSTVSLKGLPVRREHFSHIKTCLSQYFARNSAQMVQETHYGLLWHANSLLSTLWEHRYNHNPPSLGRSDFVSFSSFSSSFFNYFSFFFSLLSFLLLSPSLPFPFPLNCAMM